MKHRHLLLSLMLALAATPAHALVIRLHGEVESAADRDGVLGFELLPGAPIHVELSYQPGQEYSYFPVQHPAMPPTWAVFQDAGILSLWLDGRLIAGAATFTVETGIIGVVYGESGSQVGPGAILNISSGLSIPPSEEPSTRFSIHFRRDLTSADPLLYLPSASALAEFGPADFVLIRGSAAASCDNGQCTIDFPLRARGTLTTAVSEPASGLVGACLLLLLAARQTATGTARRS